MNAIFKGNFVRQQKGFLAFLMLSVIQVAAIMLPDSTMLSADPILQEPDQRIALEREMAAASVVERLYVIERTGRACVPRGFVVNESPHLCVVPAIAISAPQASHTALYKLALIRLRGNLQLHASLREKEKFSG